MGLRGRRGGFLERVTNGCVCRGGGGGEDPGARSLKGWRKCGALYPHSRRKLAGWARACGAAGRWAPGAVRPPRPSARAPGARAPPAPPGSPCLARTLSFSPRRCRRCCRQVPAPRPAALARSAAPSLGARSAPHRLARVLGLGGGGGSGGSSSGTVAAAPSSSFPGAAAERRALLRGSGQSGRQLLPAAPGTAGGSAPAVVRSVSAARPSPGSRHREQLAAGLRLPALPGRSRPPAAAFTSPMSGWRHWSELFSP
ncbi:translation initiation factor IF-2-like [Microtus oregoni]|uniref:translation initiation factor IF-2-like n=1 Tax=Microtus oregoni TaxID=111838 RepID=UPI001BB29AE8|nr:translation initiation factor IF-2-like [Microtus oregoni]